MVAAVDLIGVDTPIFDEMIDQGWWPDLDRYATHTEVNAAYSRLSVRWGELMRRLADA